MFYVAVTVKHFVTWILRQVTNVIIKDYYNCVNAIMVFSQQSGQFFGE